MDGKEVEALLGALTQGPVTQDQTALSNAQLAQLGLELETERILLPAGVELLDAATIEANLNAQAAQWLTALHRFPVIGSTNSWMMELATRESIHGVVATAECQIAGRGRRGRKWFSPLGTNVALSLGFALPGTVANLSGLSLAVGLAAVDALDPLGTLGLQLKWPNDVLVGNQKLSGILVEVAVVGGVPQVCVGIGVNWRLASSLRAEIEQPVIGMADLDPQMGRNLGVSRLISQIVEYVTLFAQIGLEPMLPAYDKVHAFGGQKCTVLLADGAVEGEVIGVSAQGELCLQTAGGLRHFASGEVSLRSA